MKAKIYFSDFDSEKINAGGWSCDEGRLYLKLNNPLNERSIDAVDECLKKKKFRCVGEIDAENEGEVWYRIQNIDSGHELNDRSLMVGDVIIFDDYGVIVEDIGFSKLSQEQIEKFLKIK